jgi:hypothetical protein
VSTRHWKYDGWVIDSRSDEGHGLLGRYWWFDAEAPRIPGHMEGHRTAAFRTRREARAALPRVRRTFPRAAVRRARFRIELDPMTASEGA